MLCQFLASVRFQLIVLRKCKWRIFLWFDNFQTSLTPESEMILRKREGERNKANHQVKKPVGISQDAK